MDYAGFLREGERGNVPPVALLHGSEPRLLEEALARVTRALLPDPSLLVLNREVFDADGVTVDIVVRSALTLPSFAPARLVVVKRSQALSPRDADPLIDYLRDPNPLTRLLFLADESLAPGHWLTKALPPAAVIGVPRLTGRALTAWLQERAREEGYELSAGAAHLLTRWAGEDLTTLSNELEKALLFCGPGQRLITEEEVRQVVGEHRLLKSFELADAVVRGDVGEALPLLEALLAAGEEPLAILGLLARQIRTTWQVSEWCRQGRSVEEISRQLHRPTFAVETLADRARSLPSGSLSQALTRCWEAERRLKSGGRARPELGLLVADLCRAG